MGVHSITLVFVLKLLLAEWMFSRTFPHRPKFPLRVAAGGVFCITWAWILPEQLFYHPISAIAAFFFLFTLSVLAYYLCYDCLIWNILFSCIAGYLTEHFSSQAAYILNDSVLLSGILSSDLQNLSGTVFSVAVCYTSFYFLFARRIHQGEHPNVDNKRLILISGAALFLCICISIIAMRTQAVLPDEARATVQATERIYAMLSCGLLLMLLFGILTQNRLETDLTVMHHLLHQAKEQYEMSKENIELINIKCHDLRHQIAALRDNASEEAIQEIEESVLIYDANVKTGNNVLDVILTGKSLYCQENGIRLSCMVDGGKLDFFEASDLYALFGNLIENAIEAVMKLEDPEKRDLSLIVRQERKFLLIWMENYYSGELSFQNGIPQSTKKEDIEYHGFGMKSIRMIVEKYQGTMIIDTEDNVFRLKLMIPIPNIKSL